MNNKTTKQPVRNINKNEYPKPDKKSDEGSDTQIRETYKLKQR